MLRRPQCPNVSSNTIIHRVTERARDAALIKSLSICRCPCLLLHPFPAVPSLSHSPSPPWMLSVSFPLQGVSHSWPTLLPVTTEKLYAVTSLSFSLYLSVFYLCPLWCVTLPLVLNKRMKGNNLHSCWKFPLIKSESETGLHFRSVWRLGWQASLSEQLRTKSIPPPSHLVSILIEHDPVKSLPACLLT